MENKTILTEEQIYYLWDSNMFIMGDESEDEWLLHSCLRFGSIQDMMNASEAALNALFVDNGRNDSQQIFDWIDEMINDAKVLPFTKRMSEVIQLARKAFDAKMAEYRREGWLPQSYDVDFAFRGFMGLVNGVVYTRFYEKYDHLQHVGSDTLYRTSGFFKKTYSIIALPQYDGMRLKDVVADPKYDRFDSAALMMLAEEKGGFEDDRRGFIDVYVKLKNIIIKSDGTLADVKHTLEGMAHTSKDRELYACLYTAIVLELALKKVKL